MESTETVATANPAVVLVIRDPDVSNEIIKEGTVRVIQIDLAGEIEGLGEISSLYEDDAAALLNDWLSEVADLPASNPVRQEVEEMVSEALSYMRAADKPIGDLIDELGLGQETQPPTVLVIRTPGEGNQFITDWEEGTAGAPRIIDIDLGTGDMMGLADLANLGQEEALDMIASWESEVADLAADSRVRLAVEDLVGAAHEYVPEAGVEAERAWGI